MRICTLGTSHGDSTFDRFNSSTVYETKNGTLYLVDAGAPVEALLRRKGYDIRLLKAAFVTHLHDDHAGGLSGLLKQLIKYQDGRSYGFSLYLPEENGVAALKSWIFALHEDADDALLSYRTVDDGVIYDDDELTVSAVRTCHLRTKGRACGDPCSFAFVLDFKREGVRVLHTGDFKADLSDFPAVAFAERFDLCIMEATHYPPAVALPLLQKARFDRLIFNHIYDDWDIQIDFGWRVRHGEKALLDNYRTLPYPVTVAHDGDEFLL